MSGVWGTDIKIMVAGSMLDTDVYTCTNHGCNQCWPKPSLIGPTLIHTDHSKLTYCDFASDLVYNNATLKGITFLRLDRQKELFNAFKNSHAAVLETC